MALGTRLKLTVLFIGALLMLSPGFAATRPEKEHDFLPKVNNVIFVLDVSVSMRSPYFLTPHCSRLVAAVQALKLFNLVMPPVPRWQYDVTSALLTFGDNPFPKIVRPLESWTSEAYEPFFRVLLWEGAVTRQVASLQSALMYCENLLSAARGRTAIVLLTDGGTGAARPQETAAALKNQYGPNVNIFGIFFGDTEIGWRNIYEVCELTGGYARNWEEVRDKPQMKRFAWDICVSEIMFPYTEIFFQENESDLLPSEALKLEPVAAFLRALPQYVLQVDGHTALSVESPENSRLGMKRARSVKNCLVGVYRIPQRQILIRSWGSDFPLYDNGNSDIRLRNCQAVLYLALPLRNYPYDEKHLHTFGVPARGDVYNTVERDSDREWASTAKRRILPIRNPRILH